MLFAEGLPMFLLEMAIGQRLRKGSLGVWDRVSPYWGGIGVASAIVSFNVALYYNTVIAWCLSYFVQVSTWFFDNCFQKEFFIYNKLTICFCIYITPFILEFSGSFTMVWVSYNCRWIESNIFDWRMRGKLFCRKCLVCANVIYIWKFNNKDKSNRKTAWNEASYYLI